ncbi:MAG: hypothetical protein A2138_17545 [Deltaproteobacteria bacterium RBG_16_71_12]|nr:MAG: hypothetical protein A2138_17545 [Deltaproteobacteria bacterium RBG_16_71_12]
MPTERAADILIVVDNSGSMAEEQQNLADNFLNQDPAACPLQDLKNIPEEYKNPAPALYQGAGPLAQCGFIQLVAAFENDFRVGVITTDVGLCDNRVPSAQGGDAWGFRPQRGCLQPDSAPGGTARKVLARADLDDADGANDDLAARFSATLANIATFGSPIERGLDAVNLFLDPASDRNPTCVGDLGLFRREGAALVVIFLTDEEDCSHGLGDMLAVFGNENDGEVCGEFPGHFINVPSSRCYDAPEALSPVELYAEALVATDPDVKVAVVAGGIGEAGAITPAGCLVGADGLPTGGDDVCYSSGGLSNAVGPGETCSPDTATERGGLPCCVADAGGRYYALADAIGSARTDSICNQSFRRSMIDIAAFIAAVDSVRLAEPPDSPNAVLVELTRAGSDEAELLVRLSGPADCATATGWYLEGEDRVVLCGAARPGPGDSISVRARGDSDGVDEVDACNAPRLEASGGGVNCASAPGQGMWAALALFACAVRRRVHRA